jgi:excisionase family DNA binding protein
MNPILSDKPLTVDQAAEYTGFSQAYIYKLVHLKKLPCYKPGGGKILFSLDDLKAFCFRNRQAAGYELQEQAETILTGGRRGDD